MNSLRRVLSPIVPVLAVSMLVVCLLVVFTAGSDAPWRWFVLAQVLVGLFVVCILAALRDGYGYSRDALFDFKGKDTNILSIAGALVALPSIVALIVGNPTLLRVVFVTTTVIFAFKAVYVELHRWQRRRHPQPVA